MNWLDARSPPTSDFQNPSVWQERMVEILHPLVSITQSFIQSSACYTHRSSPSSNFLYPQQMAMLPVAEKPEVTSFNSAPSKNLHKPAPAFPFASASQYNRSVRLSSFIKQALHLLLYILTSS